MTDINKETVFVTINSARRIPFLNASGPINTPISVLKTVVAQLKALGYPVKEHPYVGINSAGNREVITEEAFIARKEGQIVNVVTTEPEPALVPSDTSNAPAPTSEVVVAEQPEEFVEETVDGTVDADDSTDDTVDGTTGSPTELDLLKTSEQVDGEDSDEGTEGDPAEEGEELDVYDFAVYEGWSKQLLVNYLRKAEQFLPEEVQKETNSANKTRLLEIIKTHIIDVAE